MTQIEQIKKVKATTDCNFKEYLRGVFEANNGIENDTDLLVKLHAPTLLELAQKELAESHDFEAEWKRYTHTRKDDMRTNAVTMNVKEVAKHFAEWQKKQDDELLTIAHLDGVAAGREAERKEIMKEAVEGEVMTNGRYPYEPKIVIPYPGCPYEFGSKIKLIILKSDEQGL